MVAEEPVAMETWSNEDELGRLDIDLDRKSKQHNLTSSNVRAILHEVITHERVVAMMKAAIRDTQDLPMFEPKMTRSRVKQAAHCGKPGNWRLSPVMKPPQFVDIQLEEDEDSSDEEYCPDEEEEDEEEEEESSAEHLREQVTNFTCALPAESSFMERLTAVEEELDSSLTHTYDQSLDRKTDDGGGNDDSFSCLAYRTRSKRPLINIPLDQLEAELLAPDITADMYEQSSTHKEEDRHWTKWLQGLMAPNCEDEAEDEDDPEYNFREDLDEPDLEDYRTDRAVQITKKEVNELLEELFDTLQDEDVAAEDEEREEEEAPLQNAPKFNVPQALRFEAPLASMLTERRQIVRKQYEALQQRRALHDTINHQNPNLMDPAVTVVVLPSRFSPALHLGHAQKQQLQQQLQQHVQLLTQVHLLSRRIHALNHEADITKQYLEELQQLACHQEVVCLHSSFRVCNLQGALDLLQEVEKREEFPAAPPVPAAFRRLLPDMTPATSSHAFPLLPPDAAWLFATRPIFLYPALLPVCSLDPALHSPHHRRVYTAGEDGLIVLGLKHFEGAVQSDQLISSYLLCKSRWNFRKHVREMSSPRAPPNNIIKMFLMQGVIPLLPSTCSRVQPEDWRPPVDKHDFNMPNWLKNSQLIIQKTRLDGITYPSSLPPGCILRLHPYYVNKSRPPRRTHQRFFSLAHNASLLPLAKAPADRPVDLQLVSHLTPAPGVPLASGALPLAAVYRGPAHPMSADIIGQTGQEHPPSLPVLMPLHSLSSPNITTPRIPCSAASDKSGYFLFQVVLTPPAPTNTSQDALGLKLHRSIKEEQEEEEKQEDIVTELQLTTEEMKMEVRQMEEDNTASASIVSPVSSSTGGEEEKRKEECSVLAVSLNGGENTDGQNQERREESGGGDGEDEAVGGEQGGEREEEDCGERDDAGGDNKEDGDKDKDEDQDRQGDEEEEEEEEEEEDFDDLTQDEDEEEVMSSASEESVLSVPELQETMKQLTWLAAERRLCADGDSEEEHSPISAGSQEEEEEEEEEGPKGEVFGDERSGKVVLDEEMPSGAGTPRGGGRCPRRGRGRSRPHRGLRRNRQDRLSKDAAKLLLLYDENILDNDPLRDSKDMAFAQTYLNRVREALQDTPGQVEEFVSVLNRFEQVGEGQEVTILFRKLCCILGNRTDLLRDFAAFLHPEQALQCGLFEEQQAYERSRRFLRQLEISFGDNLSHYQKIIKALQTGPDLTPASIQELKAQMATLLKGHTHLQAEFWFFFDELRPPPARPGQFEEAHWPEEPEGGEGNGQVLGGGTSGGFEEVTLPELEEEEEGHKIQPIPSRRPKRKLDSHRNYKDCDWLDKDWTCLCDNAKIRRHRRKSCSRCHGNQTSTGVSRAMKSLDTLYSQISPVHDDSVDKNLDMKGGDISPQPDQRTASWETPFPLTEKEEEYEQGEEGDEEEEKGKSGEKENNTTVKKTTEEMLKPTSSSLALPRPSPPPELPVCAKNISLTASGEKVILWTREADRVILTTCQQEGASPNTFQAISNLLGNKTPNEVSRRFRDLMRLFRTAARHVSSEDEAPPTEPTAANET
ncbi:GON-4-like protein isoform X2 [Melanotaenia boesemani]|nr:GON-4-like protein isoform X2 [Melanotaenia boesemani]